MCFIIASHPHGISLNGYQYVVDKETKEVITFESEATAIQYIRTHNPELPEDVDVDTLSDDYGLYIQPG